MCLATKIKYDFRLLEMPFIKMRYNVFVYIDRDCYDQCYCFPISEMNDEQINNVVLVVQ